MLRTILVAVDGSPSIELMIEALKQLQLQPTTHVIFSHVIPTTMPEIDPIADRPHPNTSEELAYWDIEKHLKSYQQELDGPSDVEIVRGDPAEEIIRLANIYQTDLILIGSRGLTGVNRIVQGSVSSQVVADANCSVWVVKEKD
ncbi:universal stress protein [Lyngbya sp. CCY1209]|uniref:universal stress protein n=1 Tax=Lyngbya sp. CCY1209 TaxID=2886103 RepID=UPI002D211D38|nr:universal stress protein [Lyngbya sp. CCY1209]MEB3883416.1 universal stress protein [Lyngbya sp. CCY1209]